MPLPVAYHRPTTLDEALGLLAREECVALAGGTVLNADRSHSALQFVDLQALGLDGISAFSDGTRLRLGAMSTLAEVSENETVPDELRRLARAEDPSTLRTLSTVGGAVAAATAETAFVAGLLAHDAAVEVTGQPDMPLEDHLASGVSEGAIITGITIDPRGSVAWTATGRTPADVPIVAAVARSAPDGVRLALSGVAAFPMMVDPVELRAGRLASLVDPPSDFRGSASYRVELATVLGTRALEALR